MKANRDQMVSTEYWVVMTIGGSALGACPENFGVNTPYGDR